LNKSKLNYSALLSFSRCVFFRDRSCLPDLCSLFLFNFLGLVFRLDFVGASLHTLCAAVPRAEKVLSDATDVAEWFFKCLLELYLNDSVRA